MAISPTELADQRTSLKKLREAEAGPPLVEMSLGGMRCSIQRREREDFERYGYKFIGPFPPAKAEAAGKAK